MFKSPESVLWNRIISDASITAHVGHRVYPNLAQASDDFPFIVWRRTAVGREQTLGAVMGVPQVSVGFEIYAQTYVKARKIADAMRASLDGYSGSFENTTVSLTRLTGENDGTVVLEGSEVPVAYLVSQDYEILWQES